MLRLRFQATIILRHLTAITALVLIASCNQTTPMVASSPPPQGSASGVKTQASSAYSQFPDIPIPAGAKMDVEKTLVFGSEPWFGQLALTTSSSPGLMFDFFRGNLSDHQWQELTSVRAPTSILTYMRESRVLAIAIQSATLGGSDITITVSPRGGTSERNTKVINSGGDGKGDLMPLPVVTKVQQ